MSTPVRWYYMAKMMMGSWNNEVERKSETDNNSGRLAGGGGNMHECVENKVQGTEWGMDSKTN